jgi:hypothetical protein
MASRAFSLLVFGRADADGLILGWSSDIHPLYLKRANDPLLLNSTRINRKEKGINMTRIPWLDVNFQWFCWFVRAYRVLERNTGLTWDRLFPVLLR